MRIWRKENGFSLIEMMIVVAIVGLLAAVGGHNYNKYKVRARQSEGKALLSDMFVSMKNYRSSFDCYTSRFDAIGFKPNGELHYRVGFAGDLPPTAGLFSEVIGTATCFESVPGGGLPVCNFTPGWTNAKSATDCATGVSCFNAKFPSGEVFLASAATVLSASSIDSWSIDQDKNMKNN